jgi:hypothetical protein
MQMTYCYWQLGKKIGSWPPADEESYAHQLPMMLKRRLTLLGRQATEALYRTSQVVQNIPWVIACQHGDTNRKSRLLTSLAKEEALSPTDFSLSVHNAIIGLFSITTQNKNMHTAITNAECSFEAGLLEAFALQKDKRSTVGYLYYNTSMSGQSIDFYQANHPIICLAMILSEDKPTGQIQIRYLPEQQTAASTDSDKIASLIEYLENNEKIFTIPTPGASILLERISEQG